MKGLWHILHSRPNEDFVMRTKGLFPKQGSQSTGKSLFSQAYLLAPDLTPIPLSPAVEFIII